jgi:protein-S-isoprenylcysteine O-methyltransferase Ste14
VIGGALLPAAVAILRRDVFLAPAPLVRSDLAARILFDLALVAVFALQHSGQARPAWRAAWARRLPPATERAAYSLLSGVALALVLGVWRPIGGVVWAAEGPVARAALWLALVAGWGLAGVSTLAMGGVELLGWSQIRRALAGGEWRPPRFRAPGPYRFVRHPILLGFLVGMWGGPVMTGDRFVLVVAMSVYILVGIRLEERDLGSELGEEYLAWRARTPLLLPIPRRRAESGRPPFSGRRTAHAETPRPGPAPARGTNP